MNKYEYENIIDKIYTIEIQQNYFWNFFILHQSGPMDLNLPIILGKVSLINIHSSTSRMSKKTSGTEISYVFLELENFDSLSLEW